jgi:photosystem II stability/assembly factor-like uncharacterized protein
MVTEREVIAELTSYYRALDDAVAEPVPAWHLERTRARNAPSWRMQLLATAALLALIVGIGVLIREARMSNPTPPARSPSPHPATGLVLDMGGPVTPAGLVDGRNGWTVGSNGVSVTHDGGRTWRQVTPPGSQFSFDCCRIAFLNPREAWAAVWSVGTPPSLTIERTSDGGATWSTVGKTAPLDPLGAQHFDMFFVDPRHGWIIYQDSRNNFTGWVQQTVDGGVTWTLLPSLPGIPVQHLFFGETSIRFVDSSRGWFIGSDSNETGVRHLYMTRDGGRSWSAQRLPVAGAGLAIPLELPSFSGSSQGMLPIAMDDGRIFLAVSRDGGQTWKLGSELQSTGAGRFTVDQAIQAPTFSSRGIVAIVLGNRIAVSTGGGWSVSKPSGLSNKIAFVDFASPQIAWALVDHSCAAVGCEGTQFELFKTNDGGHTWTAVLQ